MSMQYQIEIGSYKVNQLAARFIIYMYIESLKEQLVQASRDSKDPYLEARIKFLAHQVYSTVAIGGY